jgi:hypothetical protein
MPTFRLSILILPSSQSNLQGQLNGSSLPSLRIGRCAQRLLGYYPKENLRRLHPAGLAYSRVSTVGRGVILLILPKISLLVIISPPTVPKITSIPLINQTVTHRQFGMMFNGLVPFGRPLTSKL